MVEHKDGNTRIIHLPKGFNKALKTWERIDDFIEGDQETLVSKYLTKHYTESLNNPTATILWEGRQKRTGFESDCEPFLDIHSGHLGREITFEEKMAQNEKFSAIIDDVTGFGQSAQEFYKEKIKARLKYGVIAVLVDGPSEIAATVAEAKKRGERSYQVLFGGPQILDFSWFEKGPRRGQVKSVVLVADPVIKNGEAYEAANYFYMPDDAADNLDATFIKELLVSESKISEASTDKKQFKVADTFFGKLPVVPVEIIGTGLKDSVMRKIVQQSWKIFNSTSVRDTINYDQGFMWKYAAGVKADEISTVHSASLTLLDNPDAKIGAIPSGVPTGYETQIEQEKATLKRIALLEFSQLADGTAQIQSAESKDKDRDAREEFYNDFTTVNERSELRLWQFHAMMEGESPEVVSLSISRDFGLEDPTNKQSVRGLQFSRAKQMGADDICKNLLKIDVMEMEVVPVGKESPDEARARLLKSIEDLQPEQPIAGTSFGERGSIADRVNQATQ